MPATERNNVALPLSPFNNPAIPLSVTPTISREIEQEDRIAGWGVGKGERKEVAALQRFLTLLVREAQGRKLEHHYCLVAVAEICRNTGGSYPLEEVLVPGGKIDLVLPFPWGLVGVEIDWRTVKWKSIEKLRSARLPISVYLLRHPRPDVGTSWHRLRRLAPGPTGQEYLVSSCGVYNPPQEVSP